MKYWPQRNIFVDGLILHEAHDYSPFDLLAV